MEFSAYARYLEEYWAHYAEPVGSAALKDKRGTPSNVAAMIHALAQMTPKLDVSPKTTTALMGYYPERRLLWTRVQAFKLIARNADLKETYAKDFVGESDPFPRNLRVFALSPAFEHLRASRYSGLLERVPGLTLSDCGAVLVGREGEGSRDSNITWIGITSGVEIAALSYADCAAALQVPILPLQAASPHPEVSQWLKVPLVEAALATADLNFLLPAATDYADCGKPLGTSPLIFPSVRSHDEIVWVDASPELRTDDIDALREACARLRARQVLWVTSRTFEQARSALTTAGADLCAPETPMFIVLDQQYLVKQLADAPWKWGTYWRTTDNITAFRGSDSGERGVITAPRHGPQELDELREHLSQAINTYRSSPWGAERARQLQRTVLGTLRRHHVASWQRDGEAILRATLTLHEQGLHLRENPASVQFPVLWECLPLPTGWKAASWDPVEELLSSLSEGHQDHDPAVTQLSGALQSGSHLLLVGQEGSGKSVFVAQWITRFHQDATVLFVTNPERVDRLAISLIIAAVPKEAEIVVILDRAELNSTAVHGLWEFVMQQPAAARTLVIIMSRDLHETPPSGGFRRVLLPRGGSHFARAMIRAIAKKEQPGLTPQGITALARIAERFLLTPRDLLRAAASGTLNVRSLRYTTTRAGSHRQLSLAARQVLRVIAFLRGAGVQRLGTRMIWKLVPDAMSQAQFASALDELVSAGWVAFPQAATGEVFAPMPFPLHVPSYESEVGLEEWEVYSRLVLRACGDGVVPTWVRRRILMSRATWTIYSAESVERLVTNAERQEIVSCAARWCSQRWVGYPLVLGELARWDMDRCIALLAETKNVHVRAMLALQAARWVIELTDIGVEKEVPASRLTLLMAEALVPTAGSLLASLEHWHTCYEHADTTRHPPWPWLAAEKPTPLMIWAGFAALIDDSMGPWALRALKRLLLQSREGQIVLAFLVHATAIDRRARAFLAGGVASQNLPK